MDIQPSIDANYPLAVGFELATTQVSKRR